MTKLGIHEVIRGHFGSSKIEDKVKDFQIKALKYIGTAFKVSFN